MPVAKATDKVLFVRLPAKLWRQLIARAKKDQRSYAAITVLALEQYLHEEPSD